MAYRNVQRQVSLRRLETYLSDLVDAERLYIEKLSVIVNG